MEVPLQVKPTKASTPNNDHVNKPEKMGRSLHWKEIFATIYLIGSLGGGIYLVVDTLSKIFGYVLITQGYVVYIIMCMCCNKTK